MKGTCQSCGNPSSYLTRNDVELYGVEHKGILLCPPCLADANPIAEKTNKYGINEKMSYTIDEIKHILNKSRSQICILCKTNKLKGAFKGPEHGTPWYIPGTAILKYLEENEEQEEITEVKKDKVASLKAPHDGGIDPKATYTPKEAAELTGRTRQWAALACRKKWLPGAIKIGNAKNDQWLIPGIDLLNYIQAVGNKSKLCPRKLDRENEAEPEPEPEPVDDSPVAMLTKRVEALETDLNRLRALLHDA